VGDCQGRYALSAGEIARLRNLCRIFRINPDTTESNPAAAFAVVSMLYAMPAIADHAKRRDYGNRILQGTQPYFTPSDGPGLQRRSQSERHQKIFGNEMKKIEVSHNTFYVIALSLALMFWASLVFYTDTSFLLMFFPAYILTHILIKLCIRYVVDIKYDNGTSTLS
jgi:hypothetical protein